MKTRKPVNQDCGEIDCPFCGRAVPVRRNSGGKLYFLCDFRRTGAGGCGMIPPNLDDGQAWIAARMRPVKETPPAPAEPVEKPPAAPVVTETPPPAAPVKVNEPKPGIFTDLLKARLL